MRIGNPSANNSLMLYTPVMKYFLTAFCLIIASAFSQQLFAQKNCPAISAVQKWEVISNLKLLAYDAQDRYLFFMNIDYLPFPAHKTGGSVTLRFFSSTICNGDTVVVNGQQTRVSTLEWIRQ